MTEADEATYQDFRQYVIDNYTHVRVVNENNNEVTVLDIPNDARVNWETANTSNPITLLLTIQGEDSDISIPVTVSRVELYATANTSTRRYSDPIDNATLNASGDTLTVSTDIELPTIN